MRWLRQSLIHLISMFALAPALVAQGPALKPFPSNLAPHLTELVSRSEERVVLATNGMEHGVELLTGQRAIEFLQDARARHPDRFDRMGSQLEKHGFGPTPVVFVARLVRFVPVDSRRGTSGATVRRVATASNSEGVVVTQSWDDGSDATWEGSMYVERYSDGAWATYEGQFDIATENWDVVWFEGTGGEGPGGGDPFPVDLNRDVSALQRIVPASLDGSMGSLRMGLQPCVYPWAAHPQAHEFLACLVSNAAGCTVACRMTGPAWSQCVGACGVGSYIACALQALLK